MDAGCLECSGDIDGEWGCKQCKKGFYLNDGSCHKCSMKYCLECSTNIDGEGKLKLGCTKCREGFISNEGACELCSAKDHNCIKCSNKFKSKNTLIFTCKECSEGNVLKDGKCQPPCPLGYFLNGLVCELCNKECLTCNDLSTCTTCNALFWMDGNECKKCKDQCLICTDGDTCDTCQYGYKLDSTQNECIPLCEVGKYLNSKKCENCPENCRVCGSGNTCKACRDAHFKDSDGKCQKCLPGCEVCTKLNECQECTSPLVYNKLIGKCEGFCKENQFKTKNGFCEYCSDGCKTCTDASTCTECGFTFFLENQKCTKCIKDCNLCEDDKTCTLCAEGNTFDSVYKECNDGSCKDSEFKYNGVCTNCSKNCKTCTKTSTTCTSCISTHYFENSTCKECNYGCAKCTKDRCITCANGLYLSEDMKTCLKIDTPIGQFYDNGYQNCQNNCNKCTNGSTCTECKHSFYLDNSECKLCPVGCIKCTKDKCITCANGLSLYFDEKTCIMNNCGDEQYFDNICRNCMPNCKNCLNSSTCTTCNPFYFFSNSSCRICPKGCLTCSDANTCLTCAPWLIFDPITKTCQHCTDGEYFENEKCKNCGENCKICPNSNTCKSCFPSYFIQNGICTPCLTGCVDCSDSISCNKCANGLQYDSSSKTCNYPKMLFENGIFNDNGILRRCIENCQVCSESSKCTVCNPGLTVDPITKTCISNIVSVTPTCLPGQYLNGTVCEGCALGCTLCINGNSCSICQSSKVWDPLSNICSSCPSGTFAEKGLCKNCILGCVLCTNSSSCSSCSKISSKPAFYHKNTNRCESCQTLFGVCEFCTENGCTTRCPVGLSYEGGFCINLARSSLKIQSNDTSTWASVLKWGGILLGGALLFCCLGCLLYTLLPRLFLKRGGATAAAKVTPYSSLSQSGQTQMFKSTAPQQMAVQKGSYVQRVPAPRQVLAHKRVAEPRQVIPQQRVATPQNRLVQRVEAKQLPLKQTQSVFNNGFVKIDKPEEGGNKFYSSHGNFETKPKGGNIHINYSRGFLPGSK